MDRRTERPYRRIDRAYMELYGALDREVVEIRAQQDRLSGAFRDVAALHRETLAILDAYPTVSSQARRLLALLADAKEEFDVEAS